MTHSTAPRITTERLTLRAIQLEDVDTFIEMYQHPEVVKHVFGGRQRTGYETWWQSAMYAGHWLLRGYGPWAVTETASAQLVGWAGIIQPHGWPEPEMAGALAYPYWKNGYATEAGQAVMKFAFEELQLPRVVGYISSQNTHSIAAAERLGLAHDGQVMLNGKEFNVYAKTRPSRSATPTTPTASR